MKQRYVIKGTHRFGDKVRLLLMFDELVKKKEGVGFKDLMSMGSNLGQLQEDMQQKAILMQQPDCITISYEEWIKYEYKIDDVVYVDVTSDKKEK